MKTIGHVDELGGDPQSVARLADAALEHCAHMQLLTHLAENVLLILSLEGKGGTASRDAQTFHLCESIEQLFGHAVAEVIVRFVRAQIEERQYGNGFLVSRGPNRN